MQGRSSTSLDHDNSFFCTFSSFTDAANIFWFDPKNWNLHASFQLDTEHFLAMLLAAYWFSFMFLPAILLLWSLAFYLLSFICPLNFFNYYFLIVMFLSGLVPTDFLSSYPTSSGSEKIQGQLLMDSFSSDGPDIKCLYNTCFIHKYTSIVQWERRSGIPISINSSEGPDNPHKLHSPVLAYSARHPHLYLASQVPTSF